MYQPFVFLLLLLLLPLIVIASPAAARIAQDRPARAGLPSAEVPAGLDAIPYPADNPYSHDRVELGEALFFDPLLSADRSTSCASCHQPAHGFSSPEVRSIGVHGQRALRHSPTLLNRAWGRSQRWDGRIETLEQQVLLPIQDPLEMGLSLDDALARLRAESRYVDAFEAAFPGDAALGEDQLSRALASYVRHLTLGGSPIDRFRAGEHGALDPSERAGLWIYESKGRCWKCHQGPNFSDEQFHNTGVGVIDGVPAEGRFAVTGAEEDRGRFKTPTLRGAALRGPFMHDGSLATLRDVVEFYVRGGTENPHLDSAMASLELSNAETEHLLAFLEALSRTLD